MKDYNIPVRFDGTISVKVPHSKALTDEQAYNLAAKKAMALILATVDNFDAPELQAFEEFVGIDMNGNNFGDDEESAYDKLETKMGQIWDATQVKSVGGSWQLMQLQEIPA